MRRFQSLLSLFAALLVVFPCCALYAQRTSESAWSWREAPVSKMTRAWERYEIEGFAWPHSIRSGETLNLYVSSLPLQPLKLSGQRAPGSSNYHIRIFRCGQDGVPVYEASGVAGFFPLHDSAGGEIGWGDESRRPVEFKRGCLQYWQAGRVSIQTTGWPSGVYYARLTHAMDDTKNYWVGFVIRSATPPSGSKILFKYELNTFQAYNYWGGGSLYSTSQDTNFTLQATDTVAMDRPVTMVQSQSLTYFVQNFLKVLSDSGYTIDYCNNIDLDKGGEGFGYDLLKQYPLLILWNHDEYWSANERVNTIKFLDTLGGHIARFAPNTCYWQIHWVDSTRGDYLKLYCRKRNGPGGVAIDRVVGSGAGVS